MSQYSPGEEVTVGGATYVVLRSAGGGTYVCRAANGRQVVIPLPTRVQPTAARKVPTPRMVPGPGGDGDEDPDEDDEDEEDED